jgi:Replication-relaxation
MDARTETKKYLSRWDRDPAKNKAGKPKNVRLTARDLEILKLLARFSYLPLDDIRAWVGGSEVNLRRRLGLLSRRPNLYLNRPEQQRLADANYRKMVYELDERGRLYLADHGLPQPPRKYHRNFAHELMACRIMFSFELGVREQKHVRLIQWPEIVAKLPPETAKLEYQNHIPVTITMHNEQHKLNVIADWKPFGIERQIDGKSSYCFFPGIEADTGTEPIEAGGYRSDIHRKMLAYLEICDSKIYQSHLGLPPKGFFIPFITGSHSRMLHMMELLKKLTKGEGHPSFLFKTFPPLTSFEKPPAPSGRMLTEAWHRVGSPPLKLTQ